MKENTDKPSKNTNKLLENTLDYYEESMSFKVVDNLLNKTILDSKNIKDENKTDLNNIEEEIAAVDDYEDIDEKYSKRRYRKDYDDEIVYGFEKKQRRNDEAKKSIRSDYYDDDYEEDVNYNRQKERKEQTIGDRIRQQRQIKNKDYGIYSNISNPNYFEQNMRDIDRNLIENRSINRLYERNYDFNSRDNKLSGMRKLTVSMSVLFLLILSFLVYKINSLSKSSNLKDSPIVKFQGKEYNLETLVYENEKFSNKINKLEKEISSLQNEVQSAFISKVGPNSNINTTKNKNNTNTEVSKNNKIDTNNKLEENSKTEKNIKDINNKIEENNKIEKNTKNKSKEKDDIYSNLEEEISDDFLSYEDVFEDENYVVKAGDTLSYISQKFYGSKSKINKIKEANNLKSDNLKEGQILIIPDR